MGTNFYACRLITAKEHEEIQRTLAAKQYDRVCELIGKKRTRYHIGKRSGGWQFLFCASDPVLAPWNPTRESIDKFIRQENILVKNEYGDVFTPDEFWEEIKGSLYRDEHHINGEDADKDESNHSSYYKLALMEYTTDEGFRFSKSADFS